MEQPITTQTTLTQDGSWKKLTKSVATYFTNEKVIKLTETKNSSNTVVTTSIVCAMILALAGIISVSLNHINDRNNMAKNIEAAIAKGVDPLAVKCAYETNPTATCISYALNVKK